MGKLNHPHTTFTRESWTKNSVNTWAKTFHIGFVCYLDRKEIYGGLSTKVEEDFKRTSIIVFDGKVNKHGRQKLNILLSLNLVYLLHFH